MEIAGTPGAGASGMVVTECPDWVRSELDDWLAAATIDRGRVFRRNNRKIPIRR
jgi:hypothetical protein